MSCWTAATVVATESHDRTFKAERLREEGENGLETTGMTRMMPPCLQLSSARAVGGTTGTT